MKFFFSLIYKRKILSLIFSHYLTDLIQYILRRNVDEEDGTLPRLIDDIDLQLDVKLRLHTRNM